MPVRFLSLLFVVVLAVGQMGGCEVRFNGTHDSTSSDANKNTTGRGTTTEQTIDITGKRLSVDSDTLAEVVDTTTGEVVLFGTVTNRTGVALAGIVVAVTLDAASGKTLSTGSTKELSVKLTGQTVSRNDKTTVKEKIVSDGLYATATGVFRINTGELDENLASVSPSDFTVTVTPSSDVSDSITSGVSVPASSVVFPDDVAPAEVADGANRNVTGTVKNDGTLTVFHTTVVYAFRAADNTLLDIKESPVNPSGGGTVGTLEPGTTGSLNLSIPLSDYEQELAPSGNNWFLINWTEEE
jgi:hypothetical protein